MAEWAYDDDYSESDFGATLAATMNWSGAILSALLIAGLAFWGWKLWERDVSGVPVVRALEGPMRVQPKDPGGVASEYKGLAVNRIAEERIDETAAERVVLAPEPVALDPVEDVPMTTVAAVAVDETEAQPLVEVATAPGFAVSGASAGPDLAATDTVAGPEEAPAPNATLASSPPTASATDLAVAEALGALVEETPSPQAAAGVVSATPRPQMRPAREVVVQAAAVRAAPAPQTIQGETDAAAIPAGTRLVQLGAYASPDEARAEWARAEATWGDYMVGKSRVIQEVRSGGRTFWRLRAHGFDGLSDARRFCAVLIAEGAGCIPVVQG